MTTIREYDVRVLVQPVVSTSAGVTGGWIDMQGLVNPGGREVKAILSVGVGTTSGTAGGSIQSAQDTAGTGVATVVTFATVTAAGDTQVMYGRIPANHRFVRALATVQAGRDMIVAAYMVGVRRDTG